MDQDAELAWLKLRNKTDLVLTTLNVIQQQDRGIFGETQAVIPRRAITTVRTSWRRSRVLLLFGIALALFYVVFLIGQSVFSQAEGWLREIWFSPSAPLWQYGSLVLGVALLALFWFLKQYEIEIACASGSIGGTPMSYQEAIEFCSQLLAPAKAKEQVEVSETKPVEEERPGQAQSADSDWEL